MADVININTLEELRRFLNEKGIMEVAIRDGKKKFKIFQKIALDQLKHDEVAEKIDQALNALNENKRLINKNLNKLNNIAKLNQFALVLDGLNLCATCVGFAIMYSKLDKMSTQIAEIVAIYKKGEAIQVNHEFKKILSEHSDMLDCRKKQKYYTEEQMRELVDGENNVLNLLMSTFMADISSNREELLFSILSLAQMLSASIRYFDETYYFANKDAIGEGNRWHISHDSWVSTFDKLSSSDFLQSIQDLGIFEMGLTTVEDDYLYINFSDQVKSLKQDIEDNQKMVENIDDQNLFRAVVDKTNEEIKTEIESALDDAGVQLDPYEEYIRVATAV